MQTAELKANTMFRFSIIVCVSLIFGITAMPYKLRNKLTDQAFQDTVMSIDDNGKMFRGVEVEPPEDMDETDYDIDPRMMVWKSTMSSSQDKQPLEAEEDLDELYHPSMADLLKVQIQNPGTLPAADAQAEPWQKDANIEYNQEPEEDKDDIDHPVFSKVNSEEPKQDWDEVHHKEAEYKAGAEGRVAHSEPEVDEDELYHRDSRRLPVQMKPLGREVRGESKVRVHLQPEEDMDDLYHKGVLQAVPYKAAAPVNVPSLRKHSEPEEDLDHLYH